MSDNEELGWTWKEVVVIYLKNSYNLHMKGHRETMIIHSYDSLPPGRDSNWGLHKYKNSAVTAT